MENWLSFGVRRSPYTIVLMKTKSVVVPHPLCVVEIVQQVYGSDQWRVKDGDGQRGKHNGNRDGCG